MTINTKRILFIFLYCFSFPFLLCSCSHKDEGIILSTPLSCIDTETGKHVEQLSAYDSPYTVGYRNVDNTYSLYIFASPIQYKDYTGKYALIDNTIVESNKETFAFENKANDIKTYFPKTISGIFRIEKSTGFLEYTPNWDTNGFSCAKQCVFTNMYGDQVSAVSYERDDVNFVFYPTKAGIKLEIEVKEKIKDTVFSFVVKSSADYYKNEKNGYILFRTGGENEAIIYQPLVLYAKGKEQSVDVSTPLAIDRKAGDKIVSIELNKKILEAASTRYPVKLDLSFELYLNKMPDSTIYSKNAVNNYLANYAVLGEHADLGEGWHYIRYRLNSLFHIDSADVINAQYFVRNLYSSGKVSTPLYKVDFQWSSTGIIWSKRIDGTQLVSDKAQIKSGYEFYEIGPYVQDCVGAYSWETESIGVLLKPVKNNGFYKILATSDHSLYSPYIVINLAALPTSFHAKSNINETAG